MAKVILIQIYKADPNGFGGSHRLYQTYQDLFSLVGELEVDVVEYNDVQVAPPIS